MAYSDKVVDHYENPRNVGSLDKEAADVGTGLVGAPACGDVMKLQIRVSADGVIEDARFKTFGCAIIYKNGLKKRGAEAPLFKWAISLRHINACACSAQYRTRNPVKELHGYGIATGSCWFKDAVITFRRRSLDRIGAPGCG